MELLISNLAKLGPDNKINLNGITVVSGDNNTGKSTVGKALWAMFTAFNNLSKRVEILRANKYEQILLNFFSSVFVDGDVIHVPQDFGIRLANGAITMDDVPNLLKRLSGNKINESEISEWCSRIQAVHNLTDAQLEGQVVLNTVSSVFNRQYTSFVSPGTLPLIDLTVKQKHLKVEMTADLPKCEHEIKLLHSAYYIDNPDLLMHLSREYAPSARIFGLNNSLIHKIYSRFKSLPNDDKAVDDLLTARKFNAINTVLCQLMEGTLRYMPNDGLMFVANACPKNPLRLENLSQGLRSMALLQAAFMNGAIGDDDVLILDEPEIHLHPKWQVKYAEFIVLLQKEFNLTVVLTSHSPDFIQAIRLYAKKYGCYNKLDGYISAVDKSGAAHFSHVDRNNWDSVFSRFAESVDTLVELQAEVENDECE